MWRFRVSEIAGILLPAVLVAAPSCRRDDAAPSSAPSASASAAPAGLSPELASKVLAKVGDHTITLGDYAAVLAGMDRFERLRYQTADRRKQLLDEMINVELLATEAERRGLGDKPETKELVRQILRDEVIKDLRDRQPALDQIPEADVAAYYDAHRAEFKEPERRRISAIVTNDQKTAEKALAEAKDATPKRWGELVDRYSADKHPEAPMDLAGDLGMVTPPDFGKNDNARVPEPVRAAAFEIGKVPDVLGRVVADGQKFYVVRLVGKNEPRDRTMLEAERPIRVRLMQERLHAAEADLEKELRTRFPVQIDEAALAKVTVPSPEKKP